MFLNYKQVGQWLVVFILMSVSFQINFCSCEDDFQTSVDNFMDTFDDAYSTEINSAATEQVLGLGNEIPVEVPTVTEEPEKENEVSFYQTHQNQSKLKQSAFLCNSTYLKPSCLTSQGYFSYLYASATAGRYQVVQGALNSLNTVP